MGESWLVNVPELIQHYGYLAVAVGTFLEGETVLLLLAGAAASRGHLALPTVIGVATLASFAGDQLFFLLGRRHGSRLLARWPSLHARTARARGLLERHHTSVILAVRFLYGLRVAGPIAIGMSGVPWLRFLLLNLAGAIVWAIIVAGVGYGFGQAAARMLGGVDADELLWVGALLLGVGLWWVWSRRKLGLRATREE